MAFAAEHHEKTIKKRPKRAKSGRRGAPLPGKKPSITAGKHCKVLQSLGAVTNGKTLVAAIMAPKRNATRT